MLDDRGYQGRSIEGVEGVLGVGGDVDEVRVRVQDVRRHEMDLFRAGFGAATELVRGEMAGDGGESPSHGR